MPLIFISPGKERLLFCLLNLFYTPVEDLTYYGITSGVRVVWRRPHSLSGAYLKEYAIYGYEISWMDRSHQGGVQCTWIVTLACLIFELLPFVYCHTWILLDAYLQNCTSYGYEILWVDRSHQGGVQCTWTVTLSCLIFELLPFVYYHTWILSGAYLQNCTSYGYEILWVERFHQMGVQCTWTLTLACIIFEFLPFVYCHTWILSRAYLQNYTAYGYEILWVDRSHQGGVQCTWTLTLACLIFELLLA